MIKPDPVRSRSILFIIDQLTELGGAERMMFTLANSLSQVGYKTTIVTLRDRPSAEVYRYTDELIVLPTQSCLSAQGLKTLAHLRKIIRDRKVCLVQTYFESADIFGAIASRLAGVRVICSSRRDMGLLRSAKHNLLYRMLGPLYSHVFAVSEKVARWHQQKDHIPPNRISVVHNGVALERYIISDQGARLSEASNISQPSIQITTVANVNPWKGIDVFLKAAAIVSQKFPQANFAVAGDWTDRQHLQELRSLADELKITRQVHFVGRVEDVPNLLRNTDIFALLSRTEGFPNAVIEAMAAGLPTVATAVGGTPEAVVEEATGYLVPNEDHILAAERMIRLSRDVRLRKWMGANARALVAKEFSIQAMLSRHVEVYDALLAR
jgi:L-malate glycosyltransferase